MNLNEIFIHITKLSMTTYVVCHTISIDYVLLVKQLNHHEY